LAGPGEPAGDGADRLTGRRLAAIWRVLNPKTLYQGTMLDAATLVALFAGFELLSLKQQLQRKPGSWHGTSSPNAGCSKSATLPYSQHNRGICCEAS
jgi:hypothetical protein